MYGRFGLATATLVLLASTLQALKQESPFRTQTLLAIAFSPDGKKLAYSFSLTSVVKVLDSATGKEIAVVGTKVKDEEIACFTFSPDSKIIATGCLDKTIRIWDVKVAKQITALNGHADIIASLAFSPDGRKLVSGDADGHVRVWDVATGKCLAKLDGFPEIKGDLNWVWCVAFSPDGITIAAGARRDVRLWDAKTGKHLATLSGDGGVINSLVFSSNGKELIAASSDKVVRRWNLATKKSVVTRFKHPGEFFHHKTLSTDGGTLVTRVQGEKQDEVLVWDVATGKQIGTIKGHSNRVGAVAISPNGKLVATDGPDLTVHLSPLSSQTEK